MLDVPGVGFDGSSRIDRKLEPVRDLHVSVGHAVLGHRQFHTQCVLCAARPAARQLRPGDVARRCGGEGAGAESAERILQRRRLHGLPRSVGRHRPQHSARAVAGAARPDRRADVRAAGASAPRAPLGDLQRAEHAGLRQSVLHLRRQRLRHGRPDHVNHRRPAHDAGCRALPVLQVQDCALGEEDETTARFCREY